MNKALAIDGGAPVISDPLPTFRDRSGRSIGKEERDLLKDVLDSGCMSFICGTKVCDLERAFCDMFGSRYAVAASSGTAAIHAAVIYLNPEPGDEIIVSPITDMGGVIPILNQLAVPVFVDIDPIDQNVDVSKIEAAITPRTRAIIVTHIYGMPADMDPIMELAVQHDLFVIEDCAQAHLAKYKGRLVGTIGHMGCFSFQQSKHMTTGDGGMVICNEDERFGRRLRECTDKGWPRHKGGRDHLFLAPNYHMTELQAAVGLAQLQKLDQMTQARQASARQLTEHLLQVPEVRVLEPRDDCVSTPFFFVFTIDVDKLSIDGSAFAEALKAEGVDCFNGYPGKIPIYKYPVIKDAKTFGSSGWPFTLQEPANQADFEAELCPLAEQACKETIAIWWNEALSAEHTQLIARAIVKVVGAFRCLDIQ